MNVFKKIAYKLALGYLNKITNECDRKAMENFRKCLLTAGSDHKEFRKCSDKIYEIAQLRSSLEDVKKNLKNL